MLVQQSYQIQQLDHIPSSLLEEMLTFIKKNLPVNNNYHKILTRSKFILTELVTNAIKHAQSSVTDITIQFTGTSILFIKSDKGSKFALPEINNEIIKEGYVITADIMHTLYAVSKSDRMHFYCYEHDEPFMETGYNYPEHFGLLIITKSSDEFYYTYSPTDSTNIFSAMINL